MDDVTVTPNEEDPMIPEMQLPVDMLAIIKLVSRNADWQVRIHLEQDGALYLQIEDNRLGSIELYTMGKSDSWGSTLNLRVASDGTIKTKEQGHE